jgi:hypothetical protein
MKTYFHSGGFHDQADAKGINNRVLPSAANGHTLYHAQRWPPGEQFWTLITIH